MARAITYEIRRLGDTWAVCLQGTRIVSFRHRERAMKIARMIARQRFRVHGTPVKVCLMDADRVSAAVQEDRLYAPAQVRAWLRYAAALRHRRERAVEAPVPPGRVRDFPRQASR